MYSTKCPKEISIRLSAIFIHPKVILYINFEVVFCASFHETHDGSRGFWETTKHCVFFSLKDRKLTFHSEYICTLNLYKHTIHRKTISI